MDEPVVGGPGSAGCARHVLMLRRHFPAGMWELQGGESRGWWGQEPWSRVGGGWRHPQGSQHRRRPRRVRPLPLPLPVPG